MKTTIIPLAALLLLAPLGAADTSVLGSGHLTVGAPTTGVITTGEALGVSGVDSFFLPAPAAGSVLTVGVVDNSGLGYDIDFYFFAEDGSYVESGCATEAADEVCVVPEGVSEVEVAAFVGVELDVTVFVTTE